MTLAAKPAALVSGVDRRDMEKLVPPQEAELYRLAIPWDPARTSLNRRMHWGKRSSEEIEAKELGRMFWRMDRYTAPAETWPVRVQLWLLRGSRLDDDNAITGTKALRDSIFCAKRNSGDGITPDDSPEYVTIEGVLQITLARFAKSPWVVVVVRRS